MSESRSESVFEKALREPDAPVLFRSDWHGVAALVDPFPKMPYQSLAIPFKPFREGERVLGDTSELEALSVAAVALALQRKIQRLCGAGQLALTHTEGYGVPTHPHILVYQSYERGSGAKLYTGDVLKDWPVERTLGVLSFSAPESDALLRTLDAVQRGFQPGAE